MLLDDRSWVKDSQAPETQCVGDAVFTGARPPADLALLPLPESIKAVALPARKDALAAEVLACDVVQIPGNSTWEDARRPRLFARLARPAGKPVVGGISSDRTTTRAVNARGKSLVHRQRAQLRSHSVTISQWHLAWRSDGTLVVGEGLRCLVESATERHFVGTES